MKEGPLISCLCITRGRVSLLKRAVGSCMDQDYINKELVIVYESDDLPTKEFLSTVSGEHIVKIEVPAQPKLTLGELRNLAVSECNGEYFCQWDDDDWSHSKRLSFQMDVVSETNVPACVLFQLLLFDDTSKGAYVSNRRPWESTLLCKKSLIGEEIEYDGLTRGEDTSVVTKLFSRSLIFPVIMPKLYLYVYHGNNVWTREHWGKIFGVSRRLSDESSNIIKGILDGKYSGREASQMLDLISE